jgi:hypothetical protein
MIVGDILFNFIAGKIYFVRVRKGVRHKPGLSHDR